MISSRKPLGLRQILPIVLLSLAGCGSTEQNSTAQNSTDTNDRPLVVATTPIICDLAKQIAKETIELKCPIAAGEDPHVYQAKPDDRKAIDEAKLILYGGYNFDASIIKLIEASSNKADRIAVHEVAVTKPLIGEAHEHEGEAHEHEEEKGEENAEREPDPHIWHDATNGIAMVEVITDALTKLEPNNAESYKNNATKIIAELNKIDSWIETEIATIPAKGRKLITTHDALGYFANAYGLEIEGALQGLSTEQTATAARVGELVKEVKKANVPTIFAETTANPKLIAAVAKEAKVKLSERDLYADGLGEAGSDGDTYQKMLISNTETIVEGLGGKSTPLPF
jgi:manganese/iron transport system substrate-binding protein